MGLSTSNIPKNEFKKIKNENWHHYTVTIGLFYSIKKKDRLSLIGNRAAVKRTGRFISFNEARISQRNPYYYVSLILSLIWLPPDHLLLDRSPNIGTLIPHWEFEEFKNCWNKSCRTSKILTLLYQQFSNVLISQRDMSGPRLGALSNNRWSGGTTVYDEQGDEEFSSEWKGDCGCGGCIGLRCFSHFQKKPVLPL